MLSLYSVMSGKKVLSDSAQCCRKMCAKRHHQPLRLGQSQMVNNNRRPNIMLPSGVMIHLYCVPWSLNKIPHEPIICFLALCISRGQFLWPLCKLLAVLDRDGQAKIRKTLQRRMCIRCTYCKTGGQVHEIHTFQPCLHLTMVNIANIQGVEEKIWHYPYYINNHPMRKILASMQAMNLGQVWIFPTSVMVHQKLTP